MIHNSTRETSAQMPIAPYVHNSDEEYSYFYKKRSGDIVTMGVSTSDGHPRLFVSIKARDEADGTSQNALILTIPNDDLGENELSQELELEPHDYLLLTRLLNDTEAKRRLNIK